MTACKRTQTDTAILFHRNRVIKDFKDSDKQQVEWARSYVALLEDLQRYVKENHPTGPTWNAKGGDAKGAS